MADTNGNGNGMKAIPSDLVMKLMAGGRGRNTYGPKLHKFLDSDEIGINVREVWNVEFANKPASTLYQGFMTAAKNAKLVDTTDPTKSQVWVKMSEGEVYLLNVEKVTLAQSTPPGAETEEALAQAEATKVKA